MSKIKIVIVTLLTLIVLALIGWNLTSIDTDTTITTPGENEPTYQTQQMATVVYNPDGQLTYKLTADDVKHYTEQEDTWFTKPVMLMYDGDQIATWSVSADRAKLTKERMLYLYQNVEVNSLTTTSQLERIETNSAEVNLINQDISSEEHVTLYGANFTSNGMKMRGNLRSKTAQLIEKVTTNYEIQPRANNATTTNSSR